MTKRIASKSGSLSQLSVDSLRHVTGGEETKPAYTLAFKWQPEMLKYESGTGATTATTKG